MTEPAWLEEAARRSAQDTLSLGNLLEGYRQHLGVRPEALAAELGCSPQTLRELYLCGRPTPPLNREHLSAIAERMGLDVEQLEAVLRRAAEVPAPS